MRESKKCNQCNSVKHYSLFRKKNNKSGWKDINGGLRYSYCKPCEEMPNFKKRICDEL